MDDGIQGLSPQLFFRPGIKQCSTCALHQREVDSLCLSVLLRLVRRRHLRRDAFVLVPCLQVMGEVLLGTVMTDTLDVDTSQRLELLAARLKHLRRHPFCLDGRRRDETSAVVERRAEVDAATQ